MDIVKRIGIDVRVFGEGKITGVEVYTLNLLRNLFEIDHKNEYILFCNSFGGACRNLPKFEYSNVTVKSYGYPNRLLNTSLLFFKYPKIDKLLGGLDVFFSPRYLFCALSKECKHVVTMHDLSFVHRRDLFSLKQRVWHRAISDRRVTRKSAGVITVSDSTKLDLQKYFGVSSDKIHTIYPGIDHNVYNLRKDPEEEKNLKNRYNLKDDFFLYLGTIEPRKNLTGIILAYEEYRKASNVDTQLVLAGNLGWLYKKILAVVDKSIYKKDIRLIGAVPEFVKPHLYRMANILIFTSFYEGFGFPPLEALACGTPVITSLSASFPEVLGDAGFYVNPYKLEQIHRAFQELSEDESLRNDLIRKGIIQANKYDWEKTARKTLEILESV